MCFEYDHYCEVYVEKVRVARRQHRCCSCPRPIEVGDQYLFVSGIDDGPFHSRLCNLCTQDRVAIFMDERKHGCSVSESWCPLEEVRSYIHDIEGSGRHFQKALKKIDLRRYLDAFQRMRRAELDAELLRGDIRNPASMFPLRLAMEAQS